MNHLTSIYQRLQSNNSGDRRWEWKNLLYVR